MERIIENEREYNLVVTIKNSDWYTLEFRSTKYLKELEKELVLETFEEAVNNIRERLKQLYNGKD